ncbi:MAG: hypothetical protein O3B01_31865 [Planctomycetota bacterium]|nr:hypothetical protein [Planctomycetota bacterium]MDA1143181.1 hypothetical protein [Planctomycetota bacterium]
MKSATRSISHSAMVATLLCSLSACLQAGEPNASALDAAIKSGEFSEYLTDANAWLEQKTPAKPTEAALVALLKDPVYRTVLDQRQFIAKTGADQLGAFAKADPNNREFLGWLMNSAPVMDLYLEANVPIGLSAREANTYTLDTAALDIWKWILKTDPDARDGIYLKLAIATGIAPPGSVNIGAGGAAKHADPIERYMYYKNAYQNKELLPSFDNLSVWEYSRIVSSGASHDDLTWARDMVNTFRPDLRDKERVVRSTSLVWRRAAPKQFYPNGYVTFRNVLAGGGKCGPKSSWGVMVNQAFGVPAIGVGQPRHACVAYKAAYPENQPQPGHAWKVDYGRGWQVSKLLGLKGEVFLAGVVEREYAADFSQVEHLRWLAAALSPADRATAVMAVAESIRDSVAVKIAAAAASTPETSVPKPASEPDPRSTIPNKAVDGVIHVEAASFAKTGGKISWGGQKPYVEVFDCYAGGKQVYFEQQMTEQWADYIVDVPSSGTYHIVMKAACVNEDQSLDVCSGTNVVATVPISLEFGLWVQTSPVELKLENGVQILRIQTSTKQHMRGIALRWFELKAKGK